MGGLPKPFVEQSKIFAETTLMVRQPALDIINNLKSTDFRKPAIRYLLCILLAPFRTANKIKIRAK